MILSDSELKDLTGLKQKAAQIRWLVARRWRFEVSSTGRARVAVAEFNRRMVSGRAVQQEPDFAALNGQTTH